MGGQLDFTESALSNGFAWMNWEVPNK
jgi:hypothetical protein